MQNLMSLAPTVLKEKQRDPSWDFAKADTKEFTHNLHTYPAMMIPQVARRLIRTYGKTATSIIDPFMGSGSVLVEGMLHESINNLYGLDINPLAILIAKVKTTPINPDMLEKAFSNVSSGLEYKMEVDLGFFNLHNINYWFKQGVIKDLSRLKNSIDKIEDEKIKNFFLVCFSETVRKVSNTRQGEFKLYRIEESKLETHSPDAIAVFNQIVNRNINGMRTFYGSINFLDKTNSVKICEEDTRLKTSVPSNSCDLLVTSPPYGDSRTTVAYGQFSRLSSQLLGYSYDEIKKVDQNGLGGKRSYKENGLPSVHLKDVLDKIESLDNMRALDVLSFYHDFNKCIAEIDRIMKADSRLCFVVGNRTVKGVKIPTDEIISELFTSRGNYKHITTFIRKIPNKRMPRLNSPSNVKGITSSTMSEEYVVVLKKI